MKNDFQSFLEISENENKNQTIPSVSCEIINKSGIFVLKPLKKDPHKSQLIYSKGELLIFDIYSKW